MVDRAFLKPVTVNTPPQGDYQYVPVVRFYEDTTRAGLQSQLDVVFGVNAAQADTELWVIEQVEYQVIQTRPYPNSEYLWTAMVWAHKALRV